MVFLRRRCHDPSCRTRGLDWAHLIAKGPQQVLHRLAIIFPELAKVFDENFVQPCVPVIPDNADGARFQRDQVPISRFPAHDLEAVGRVLEEAQPAGWTPEIWMEETCCGVRS
jgi:hypothetical protein